MTGIVTLTMNPALDVSTSVERVIPTRKLRCSAARFDPGGGGINVARMVKRLGLDVTAVYPAGGEPGRRLRYLLDGEGISSRVVEIAGMTREDVTVLDRSSNDQFRFVFPGPELKPQELRSILDLLVGPDPSMEYVVASGSLPPGVPDDFYAQVGAICRGRGARFVLDTSGAALKHAMEKGVFLVKPSLGELRELVGRTLETETEWCTAARGLVESGKAEIVALTLGDRGAVFATRQATLRAPGLAAKVVSAVGAGDSFLGALVAALARREPLDIAFRYAVAAGTATLLKPGTELCQRADVDRFFHQVALSDR